MFILIETITCECVEKGEGWSKHALKSPYVVYVKPVLLILLNVTVYSSRVPGIKLIGKQ